MNHEYEPRKFTGHLPDQFRAGNKHKGRKCIYGEKEISYHEVHRRPPFCARTLFCSHGGKGTQPQDPSPDSGDRSPRLGIGSLCHHVRPVCRDVRCIRRRCRHGYVHGAGGCRLRIHSLHRALVGHHGRGVLRGVHPLQGERDLFQHACRHGVRARADHNRHCPVRDLVLVLPAADHCADRQEYPGPCRHPECNP